MQIPFHDNVLHSFFTMFLQCRLVVHGFHGLHRGLVGPCHLGGKAYPGFTWMPHYLENYGSLSIAI
jgi:hypothetical protein